MSKTKSKIILLVSCIIGLIVILSAGLVINRVVQKAFDIPIRDVHMTEEDLNMIKSRIDEINKDIKEINAQLKEQNT